ncbi:hypothetical protein FRC12_021608, partial [Ceratobasidium sp. 428]
MSEDTYLWKMGMAKTEPTELVVVPHTPEAHYKYAGPGAVPRNGCIQHTRVAILQDLRDWVYYGRSQNVLWINGTAGVGKTTIAYSLCEILETSGRLSASFFCSRRLPSCRDVSRMVPSISYQLAQQSRPYRCALSRALDQDPEVYRRSINEQFDRLILVPLQAVAHTFNADPVIVVDGLDQCDDVDSVKCAIDSILRHASDLPVRFLIVSRPSSGILGRMRNSRGKQHLPLELRLHQEDRTVVQGDIGIYLMASLSTMTLPADDLERLLQRVGVLFFYAEVLVTYITDSEGVSSDSGRLNDLLDAGSSSDSCIQNTDIAYATMLEELLDPAGLDTAEESEMNLILSALVAAQERLSVNAIAGLLRLDLVHVVSDSLRGLMPVLRVSSTDGRVIFLDEPFVEYLSSNLLRRKLLYGDRNLQLAHACFEVIRSVDPPFNICNLESSYLEDQLVSDLSERIEDAIPPELLYACRRWTEHMTLAKWSDNVASDLEAFLSDRLLLWMEILNLKRCMGQGVEGLLSAGARVQREMCSDSLQDTLEDAYQFVKSFSSRVISSSTPHIYLSQLQFWPRHSWISRYYHHRLKGFVSQTHVDGHTKSDEIVAYSPGSVYSTSGSNSHRLQIRDARTRAPVGQPAAGHTDWVYSVAYSSDGAYIASGSRDKTIRIWDADTGRSVGQPLTYHTDLVRSVAYSPDGAYIASGSRDSTVLVWDALTGKPVAQSLAGHTRGVDSVAYSPDGAHIASGSEDLTIQIWHAHTGKPVGRPLTGSRGWVWSVAYSPDGAYIASGSMDSTVRIWDVHTGKPVGQSFRRHAGPVNSVAYSPDGMRIASGSNDHTVRIWDVRTGRP